MKKKKRKWCGWGLSFNNCSKTHKSIFSDYPVPWCNSFISLPFLLFNLLPLPSKRISFKAVFVSPYLPGTNGTTAVLSLLFVRSNLPLPPVPGPVSCPHHSWPPCDWCRAYGWLLSRVWEANAWMCRFICWPFIEEEAGGGGERHKAVTSRELFQIQG